MTTKQKGTIAELAVASKLIEQGWTVLFPIQDDTRYDLVAEKDAVFVRIQVKYTTPHEGVLRINCKSSNNWSVKPYKSNEIDAIAVYYGRDSRIIFLPVATIKRSSMHVRIVKAKNNQEAGTRPIENCHTSLDEILT